MGKDEQKSKEHGIKMIGSKAWNKGIKGRQSWHNISGFKPGWNKGIPNIHVKGNKNVNWKGGVTKEYEKIRKSLKYKEWRLKVFKRDKYLCVICGTGGWGNIEADHIKPFALYPDLRLKISNGRTLCKGCHRKTDSWGTKMSYRGKIPKKNIT